MRDLDKALEDIVTIRQHMTAGKVFRGFGPLMIAATAILALATGALQTAMPALANTPFAYFTTWIITAIIAVLLVGSEMVARSKRHHGGLRDEMLYTAAGHLLPAGIIGALLLAAFGLYAPDLLWLLPSLWLIMIGCGILAAMRMLPPIIAIGAAFYIISGFMVFLNLAESRSLTPWSMALPFGANQAIMALLLHTASRKSNV